MRRSLDQKASGVPAVTQPSQEDVHWLLAEAAKRGFRPEPKKTSLREIGRRGAVLTGRLALVGLCLVGFWTSVLVSIDYLERRDERRQERLFLECLQGASNKWAAGMCSHFKPSKE